MCHACATPGRSEVWQWPGLFPADADALGRRAHDHVLQALGWRWNLEVISSVKSPPPWCTMIYLPEFMGCSGDNHWDNNSHQNLSSWWFQTWLLFSISYMGCHPSHWRIHIFQGGYCTTDQIYTISRKLLVDFVGRCYNPYRNNHNNVWDNPMLNPPTSCKIL